MEVQSSSSKASATGGDHQDGSSWHKGLLVFYNLEGNSCSRCISIQLAAATYIRVVGAATYFYMTGTR